MNTQPNEKAPQQKQSNPPVHTKADERAFRHVSAKARRRRRRLVTLLIVVLLLVLAAVPFYQYVYEPYQARSAYQSLKTLYGLAGTGSLPAGGNQQLGALYDVNPDVAGWLIVPGTDIDLPVVKTEKHDSVYYVNHLFDGTPSAYGTPYFLTDPRTNLPRGNTVIRGGEKLMGDLDRYCDLAFYADAPLLFLDTMTTADIYKIFAVVRLQDEQTDRFAKNLYATKNEFLDFVADMGRQSLVETGVKVRDRDRLLTLLCDTPSGKMAVIGRAVRDDEDYTVDTSAARAHAAGAPLSVTETDVNPSTQE